MKYLVSQEIKSETKVGKHVYVFDLFFVLLYSSVVCYLGITGICSGRAALSYRECE